MIQAIGDGVVSVNGLASLDYCRDCNETEKEDQGYKRASTNSSFYFQRQFGYDLSASLGVSVGVPGANFDTGLVLSIVDENLFDDTAPNITLPSAKAFLDSIKFSPRSALLMLTFIDGE